MTTILIRESNGHRVETDGCSYLLNGAAVAVEYMRGHPTYLAAINSGTIGANGKRNMIGLTAEHIQIHVAARDAHDEAALAAWRASDEGKADLAAQAAEIAYDRRYNEGGEGYNPHRRGDRRAWS